MEPEEEFLMTPAQTNHERTSCARPIGRFLRLVLGGYLIIAIAPFFVSAELSAWLQVAAAIVALVFAYTLVHLGVRRWTRRLNPCLGAALALLPIVMLYMLGGTVGRVAAVGYVAVSLLVDFANGDKGCEVMALPALILRRRMHLACLVLSPLDSLEDRVSRWLSARRTSRRTST